MGVRTVAVCDLCGVEEVVSERGPLTEAEFAIEIVRIGWRQRDDALQEICPDHHMSTDEPTWTYGRPARSQIGRRRE